MGLYIGTSFVTNSDGDGLTHKSFQPIGINTEFVGIITASDGAAYDNFGYSVAVGSGRIVVGAFGYDNETYIFDLDRNQVGIITASDAAGFDRFGESVAVGSGKIVVGAYVKDIGSNSSQGAAYIYDLDGTNENRITASDGAAGDYFGYSVAVGSGRIVVGAPDNNINSNADQGSAYIFDLNGNQLEIITASDGAAGDHFGYSVAVGSGRIVVGAYEAHIGSNADQGAAYIFDLNGNQLGIITAFDGGTNDKFGTSVAVGSGRIVVGSNASGQGAAYIYDLDGNNEIKITDPNGSADDRFGNSVAVGSGRIVLGADGIDIGANANQGAAFIYDLDGTNENRITVSDDADSDYFGIDVAVGSGKIVVGAYVKDIGSNNSQGAAYMWKTNKALTSLSDYYDEIVDHYRY